MAKEDKQSVKWRYSRWGVVILLSILGPLGLPFLWRSPSFGKGLKWLMTVLLLVFTGLLMVTAELLPLLISQTLLR